MRALVLLAILAGQDKPDPAKVAEEEILEKKVREDITYLAGDSLEGRMAGGPGAAKAAEYIRGAFKKAGLKPAPGGGYSQPFAFAPRVSVQSMGQLGKGDGQTENVLGYFELAFGTF